MREPANLFVAVYSAQQDEFFIDTLAHILQINRNNVLHKNRNDPVIIGVCESESEARNICTEFICKQAIALNNAALNRLDGLIIRTYYELYLSAQKRKRKKSEDMS